MPSNSDTLEPTAVPVSLSIGSLIVGVLEAGPADGMTVTRIRDAILDRHDRRIALTTLHVIVRQLERTGRIIRHGHVRALPERFDGNIA